MSFQILCPFKKLNHLPFYCWVIRVLCMFRIQVPYQIYDLKYFFPILWIVFLLCSTDVLNWFSPVYLFFFFWFVCLWFWYHVKSKVIFSPMFSFEFYSFGCYHYIFHAFWVSIYIWCEVRVQFHSFACAYLVKYHGQKSLVGYSPWGHKNRWIPLSDSTTATTTTTTTTNPVIPEPFVEKTTLSSLNDLGNIVKNQLTIDVEVLFLES